MDGEVSRYKISKTEIREEGYQLGQFYRISDDETFELSKGTLNGIKLQVANALNKLELGDEIGEIKWN